ncbi:hypothetical protein G7Y89_g9730 [Cudoniella acicularis]|uniref:Spherulin-4 n=1 Tax=Cudoniella acicularis TaxID=354080 RepID=A0A8H4RGS2_9HELO|nr:hypothetical protein G7Y89_g9730 [Cudoniella acicularis]
MRSGTTWAERRSKVCGVPKYLLWVLLGLVVIVIVVPIGVMFGRKKGSPGKSSVLLPLYVYPDPGAWDPLFTAIESNPHVNFTVVVNPASGPGTDPGPDANYTSEIPKLNQYPNVRTVGYVSTNYTNRNFSDALQDVMIYSLWSANTTVPGLGMNGIFLDETPNEYNAASALFLEKLAVAIRSQTGLGKDPLIIHNPGTLPDAQYILSPNGPNVTIVFEGEYSTYQTTGIQNDISGFQSSSKCSRDALACILHSLPTSFSDSDVKSLVKDLRYVSGSIFVTGLSVDYYSSFWSGWQGFVGDVVT